MAYLVPEMYGVHRNCVRCNSRSAVVNVRLQFCIYSRFSVEVCQLERKFRGIPSVSVAVLHAEIQVVKSSMELMMAFDFCSPLFCKVRCIVQFPMLVEAATLNSGVACESVVSLLQIITVDSDQQICSLSTVMMLKIWTIFNIIHRYNFEDIVSLRCRVDIN